MDKAILMCALDFSKAFDKVNRTKLFNKLNKIFEERKIDKALWLALYLYYESSLIIVRNKKLITIPIKINRGVKQGGPMSPRLYSVYAEEMLNELQRSNIGAKYNEQLLNALMYADDTFLLAENEKDMISLIKIVQSYCEKNEIKLNLSKTVYIIANSKSKKKLRIGDLILEPEESTKYLGYMINKNMCSKEHISLRIKNTLKRYYSLNILGLNDKTLNFMTKAQLIQTFCLPILYYSIENVELTKRQKDDIRSTVGELLKKSFNLRKECHITDLMAAAGIRDPLDTIMRRKLDFFSRLLNNETTYQLITNENKEVMFDSQDATKPFIEKIYEIIGRSEIIENTDEIEVICVRKIQELDSKFYRKLEEPTVFEIKKLLEKNESGPIENIITAEKFQEWLDREEADTLERVDFLHKIYDVREEMEHLYI